MSPDDPRPTPVPPREPTQVPPRTPTQVPPRTPTQVPPRTPTQVPPRTPTQVPARTPTQVPPRQPTQAPPRREKSPAFEEPIQVRFNAEDGAVLKLPAREAVLTRSLGSAVRWRYRVYVPHDSDDRSELNTLARMLGRGRVKATAWWSSNLGVIEFGLPSLVTGTWWDEQSHHVVVEAQNTVLKEEKPNPLLPRWRVHHVDDLWRLAAKFSHLARLPDSTVKNALATVRLPDGDRANVVQAGVSDWDFLAMLLWQYRLLGDAKLQPMILSGSVEAGWEGTWMFTWGSQKAFQTAGQVAQRTVRFDEKDGYERPMFFPGREIRPEHLLLPHARVPGGGILRHRRPFHHKAWTEWRTRDVPLFTEQGQMCWRVVDRLYDTGSKKVLGWTSSLEFLPPESTVHQEHPPRPFEPWIAAGKVKRHYQKGPWLDVELPTYSKEQNENLVYNRLKTIHSGLEGHAGIHLIPELNMDVMVSWSGRFDESVIYGDNFRSRKTEATHPHPSCWIESDALEQHANILIKSVGQTVIDSDWKTDIQKKTEFQSVNLMRFLGNGVKSDHLDEFHVLKAQMPPNQQSALQEAAAKGVPFCKRCMGLE